MPKVGCARSRIVAVTNLLVPTTVLISSPVMRRIGRLTHLCDANWGGQYGGSGRVDGSVQDACTDREGEGEDVPMIGRDPWKEARTS